MKKILLIVGAQSVKLVCAILVAVLLGVISGKIASQFSIDSVKMLQAVVFWIALVSILKFEKKLKQQKHSVVVVKNEEPQ